VGRQVTLSRRTINTPPRAKKVRREGTEEERRFDAKGNKEQRAFTWGEKMVKQQRGTSYTTSKVSRLGKVEGGTWREHLRKIREKATKKFPVPSTLYYNNEKTTKKTKDS